MADTPVVGEDVTAIVTPDTVLPAVSVVQVNFTCFPAAIASSADTVGVESL